MITPPTNTNLEDLLLTFRRKMIEVCRKENLPEDLTLSQVEIVKFIGPRESVTMKSIAEYLNIAPPSATSIVTELEKKHFVKRAASPTDRRTVLIILTKRARGIYETITKHKENILKEMLSRLNPKDKQSLERIITILISK